MAGGSASSQQSAPVNPAISGGSAADQMSQQVVNEMPAYYAALEQQMPGYSTSAANAANQGTASTIGADTSLYNQYAPLLNQISQNMGASNLQANTNALGQTIGSPQASGLVGSYGNLQNQMNPAYNSSMQGLSSMMQNQNPNALSGSEQAGIERGMNQSNASAGNGVVQNPLTNIGNAMLFGQGLQQKQANFANLASSSANTANALNAGQNAFGLATGQPSGTGSPNTSTSSSQFLTSPNNSFGLGNTSAAIGGGIMNQIGSTFNSANSAQAGQQQSSGGSASGNICCFAAILGRESIPWFVRSARDGAYGDNPYLLNGYSYVASILVPLMNIAIIYWLVKTFMVKPLVEHCGYLKGIEGYKPHNILKNLWFKIWTLVGKFKS